MKLIKHKIIVETANTGLSAYVQDLLGVVTTGADLSEIKVNITEALELYYESKKLNFSLNYQIQ